MEETHVQLTQWSRVALLLELILADVSQNFPSFETQRFVAMFTKACRWLLNRSQMNPLYMVTTIWTLVMSCPRLRLSNCLLRFSDRNRLSFAPCLGLPSVDVSDNMENSGVINYEIACLWWFSYVSHWVFLVLRMAAPRFFFFFFWWVSCGVLN